MTIQLSNSLLYKQFLRQALTPFYLLKNKQGQTFFFSIMKQ